MKQLIMRLGEKGPFGVIEAILWRIEARLGRLRRRFEAVRLLREVDFKAEFVQEGGIEIALPRVSSVSAMFGMDNTLFISADFLKSASAVSLLRQTIYRLYSEGQINPEKSIVDVGCWCADNTLAWAQLLRKKATVYAVDPSSGNLAYAQAVAKANGIDNVTWVQAVCSNRSGEALGFTGPIEHARFHVSSKADARQMASKTLDEIVGPENRASIGLLHVDVEGFEERVLRGGAGIIEESNPVITFEQHLCDEDSPLIFDFMIAKGYKVFMLNELMTNCRLDCRNFIAFPSGFMVPSELTQQANDGGPLSFVPAVLGPNLLEFVPEISLGRHVITTQAETDKI